MIYVKCDACHGQTAKGMARCQKCDGYGTIAITEPVKIFRRTIAGALVWYGFLGLCVGGLIVWFLRGFK